MMLRDRVAVVTGGGRGIGRSIAQRFAREGASCVVNDVDGPSAEATAAQCRELAQRECARASVGSVADSEYTKNLMSLAAGAFGKIDIVVNNAGLTRDGVIHRMSEKAWRDVLDVNLTGTFNCIQAAAPYIREPSKQEVQENGTVRYHRKIINFSSTAAVRGNPGQINYAAAKFGIIGLTRSLAREWAPFQINVNCIIPGFTDTPMTQPQKDGVGIPEAKRRAFIESLPFGRPARPEDVANVVLFLASELSDWVTGQEINASGGHQIP